MKKIADMDIIAHRGGNTPFVENTLESFLYSIRMGFKALEMDVRYSYTGKFFFLEHDFLHHPRYRKNIAAKIFPDIPSDISLFIEIKTNSIFSDLFSGAFVQMYKKQLEKRRCFVVSYNPFVLMRIRRLKKDIKTGYICGSRFFFFLFKYFLYPFFFRPDIFMVSRRILNRRTVRYAKKHGMKVYSYVINRNEDRHRALDLDLDGIVTDYPL